MDLNNAPVITFRASHVVPKHSMELALSGVIDKCKIFIDCTHQGTMHCQLKGNQLNALACNRISMEQYGGTIGCY